MLTSFVRGVISATSLSTSMAQPSSKVRSR